MLSDLGFTHLEWVSALNWVLESIPITHTVSHGVAMPGGQQELTALISTQLADAYLS